MIVTFTGKPGSSVSVDVGDDFEFDGMWYEMFTNTRSSGFAVVSDDHHPGEGEVHFEGVLNRSGTAITAFVPGFGTFLDDETGGYCTANVYTERDADGKVLAVVASYRGDEYAQRELDRQNAEAAS